MTPCLSTLKRLPKALGVPVTALLEQGGLRLEEGPFVIRMDDPSRRMAVFYCGELGYRSWSSIIANAVRYKTRAAAEADIRRFSMAIEPESQITVTKA